MWSVFFIINYHPNPVLTKYQYSLQYKDKNINIMNTTEKIKSFFWLVWAILIFALVGFGYVKKLVLFAGSLTQPPGVDLRGLSAEMVAVVIVIILASLYSFAWGLFGVSGFKQATRLHSEIASISWYRDESMESSSFSHGWCDRMGVLFQTKLKEFGPAIPFAFLISAPPGEMHFTLSLGWVVLGTLIIYALMIMLITIGAAIDYRLNRY